MQWLIQDSGITFSHLENNVLKLRESLLRMNIPFHSIGYIPERDIITGLEEVDLSIPTMWYGSTKIAEKSTFYKESWFDPNNWTHPERLLNGEYSASTVENLLKSWPEEPTFIKPLKIKQFTGFVIEPEDELWWKEEYPDISLNSEIILSKVQNIQQEWRFFIIDRKVVAGSQYRHNNMFRIYEKVEEKVWDVAQNWCDDGLPNKEIVMDICRLDAGEYKVIEYNSIASSGMYNCNVDEIVKAIERLG